MYVNLLNNLVFKFIGIQVHQKAINSYCSDNSDREDELNNKKRKIVDNCDNIEKNKDVNDSNVSIVIAQNDFDGRCDVDGGNGIDGDNNMFGGASTVLKKMAIDEMLKCIDSSSDSETEYDNDAKTEEKIYTFPHDLSDSGEDSEKLDYSWIL